MNYLSPISNQSSISNAQSIPLVFQLQIAEKYKGSTSPNLTRDKRQVIESKLALERIAQKNAAQRLKNDQLFVRYTSNPYMPTNGKSQQSLMSTEDGMSQEGQSNIIEAIGQVRHSPIPPFPTSSFSQRKDQYLKRSAINQRLKEPIVHHQISLKDSSDGIVQRQRTFQEILTLEEPPFVSHKEANPFKTASLSKETLVVEKLLNKHHFHFNAGTFFNSKYRVPIERHISTASRKTILYHENIPKDSSLDLNSNESNLNVEAINFSNLIGVSSGRFTPQIVSSSLNSFSSPLDDNIYQSAEETEHKIEYPKKTSNQSVCFDGALFQRQQIMQYLKLQPSKEQKHSLRKYEQISSIIKAELHTRNEVISTKINDKRLHKALEGKINENISFLINQAKKQEVDAIIRESKQHKDRSTTFKNMIAIDTLKQKKEYDRKIRQALPNYHCSTLQ